MLYIVATPIGNKNDITLRALEVLSGVDLILAEDTRKTKNLLSLYPEKQFRAQIVRLDDHIVGDRLSEIVSKIKSGMDTALVSNAGTPQVSDPGNLLVQKCVDEGIRIVPIPGPSALTAILAVANFYTEPMVFLGFLPKKKGRQTTLENIKLSLGKYGLRSAVIYESPHRFIKTLNDLGSFLGLSTHLVVGRELTKQFEEVWYGTIEEAVAHFRQPRGEFVLLIELRNQ